MARKHKPYKSWRKKSEEMHLKAQSTFENKMLFLEKSRIRGEVRIEEGGKEWYLVSAPYRIAFKEQVSGQAKYRGETKRWAFPQAWWQEMWRIIEEVYGAEAVKECPESLRQRVYRGVEL